MHLPYYDIPFFLNAVQPVQVFDPLLIGKYQRRGGKTDSVFLDVDFIFPVIPFYGMASNDFFRKRSITPSITFVKK